MLHNDYFKWKMKKSVKNASQSSLVISERVFTQSEHTSMKSPRSVFFPKTIDIDDFDYYANSK